MKYSAALLLLFGALLLSTDGTSANENQGECGSNAAPASCGGVCEPTCGIPDRRACPLICEIDGCRCLDGFLRDRNTGTCVQPEDCPPTNESSRSHESSESSDSSDSSGSSDSHSST